LLLRLAKDFAGPQSVLPLSLQPHVLPTLLSQFFSHATTRCMRVRSGTVFQGGRISIGIRSAMAYLLGWGVPLKAGREVFAADTPFQRGLDLRGVLGRDSALFQPSRNGLRLLPAGASQLRL
jgi:hypothetical protein